MATRAEVSEKEANAFLNALYAEVVEALKTDKQVKINGLGIFKLQAVAPRKSVNVVTGEAITIDGYNKVAFVPEAGVKELVESHQPSAFSDQPAEADPIKKLGTQAEEIVDILGELGQSPKEAEKEPEIPETPEEPAREPEPVAEEPAAEQEPAKEPEPVFYFPQSQQVHEPEPVQKKEKKNHFFRDTMICVVILLLLLLVGYFFLRNQLGDMIDSLLPGAQTEQVAPEAEPATEPVVTVPEEEPISVPVEMVEEVEAGENELTEEQILAEFLEASGETVDAETPDDDIYDGLITIEPMHEASRLTWMAKRFYGSKAYWPYIYQANKDHISNPDKIDVGTPIRVPKLTKAQRDTTSRAYKKLLQEAEEACMK